MKLLPFIPLRFPAYVPNDLVEITLGLQRGELDKYPVLVRENGDRILSEVRKILELGAGQGQDARFFAARGHRVYSTDISDSALDWGKAKIPPELKHKIAVLQLDLLVDFPFSDGSFDVVYARLSLHYFDQASTTKIFGEIGRVLKKGGLFVFLVNSIHDPEYGGGQEMDDDFFNIDGVSKRYFSVSTAKRIVTGFDILLLDDLGETYKDRSKGVHHLIRFAGTKAVPANPKAAASTSAGRAKNSEGRRCA